MTAPAEKSALDRFHEHLDACARCRNNPFDLCSTGLPIFIAAGQEAAAKLGVALPGFPR